MAEFIEKEYNNHLYVFSFPFILSKIYTSVITLVERIKRFNIYSASFSLLFLPLVPSSSTFSYYSSWSLLSLITAYLDEESHIAQGKALQLFSLSFLLLPLIPDFCIHWCLEARSRDVLYEEYIF